MFREKWKASLAGRPSFKMTTGFSQSMSNSGGFQDCVSECCITECTQFNFLVTSVSDSEDTLICMIVTH